jgi:hypothetical protein
VAFDASVGVTDYPSDIDTGEHALPAPHYVIDTGKALKDLSISMNF